MKQLNFKALFVYMAGQLEDEGILILFTVVAKVKCVPDTDVFSAQPAVWRSVHIAQFRRGKYMPEHPPEIMVFILF
ncbi:hypothetical protein [Desulfonema magnum]|uniref:hypothetical protein n=1 Tax=Desulfonema magnum TaxID=45655 RepID=UPI001A9BD43D|nr:hypothetical protein [Desulfonema magnum]